MTAYATTTDGIPTIDTDATPGTKMPKKKSAKKPKTAKKPRTTPTAKKATRKPAKKTKKTKTTTPKKAKAPKAKKANSAKPHKRTGTYAFEARPWLDPQEVKATMGPDHTKVYDALRGGTPRTLVELADRAFANKPNVAKARSRVRNAMRRLRDGKLVERVDAGTYRRMA